MSWLNVTRDKLITLLQYLLDGLRPHELAQPGGGVVEEGGPGGGEPLASHVEDHNVPRLPRLLLHLLAVHTAQVQAYPVTEPLTWSWHSEIFSGGNDNQINLLIFSPLIYYSNLQIFYLLNSQLLAGVDLEESVSSFIKNATHFNVRNFSIKPLIFSMIS